ncbi:acyl-CoA thioesterase [[Mycobacterium] vasticus]|uniref:Thioesterase family protein n=1 Tax=[Mycobacterium] vasticus TaxID=2875777 RepID=A0ABU5Z532_9MYCO|nr:thioesterase family protein [Mycolicibacter sp. MYC017]MEB3071729.1 thioesterase family protein [Mycolicibacter sp. MYC017]
MTLSDFNVRRSVSTRWADADVFGHINTSVYIQLFDTAINGWLVEETDYQPQDAPVIGVVAHYDCEYHREVHFPDALIVGLRINSIGRTSVTYDAALFSASGSDGEPARLAARACWVHVYVDRHHRRPVAIPATLRTFLQSKQLQS